MASPLTSPEFRRVRRVLRWVSFLVLVLGLAGAAAGLSVRGAELLLAEVQLMTGTWQPESGDRLSLSLELARVVVPLATTAFLFLLATDLVTLVRSRTRYHTVVVGRGAAATAIAGQLTSTAKVLVAEAGDEDSLRDTGVRQARAIVVCGDDGFDTATNVATADAAMRLAQRPDFTAHLLVGDPGLALALRARRLVQPDNEDRRIRVFTVDELAVRQHVRQVPLDPATRTHILVVGSGAFGRAVIVEYGRRWSSNGFQTPLLITLVADDATAAVQEITDRWPFVAQWCELKPIEYPVERAMLVIAERPYRAYFTDPDEQRAMRTALTAATRWQPSPGSVVVRVTGLSTRSGLFDDLGGALEAVGVYQAAASEMLVHEEPLLAFARGIHGSYVDDALRRGEPLRSRPLLVPWEELPEEAKESNVQQARAFPRTLAAIHCTVAPRTRLANPFYYRPGEVETLARAEHEHWVAEQRAAGWRHGDHRDDRRKVHPLLVPWEGLSPADRSRNRAIVRARPQLFDRVLEREGLQIVRLAAAGAGTRDVAPAWLYPEAVEHLAPIIHATFLAARQADGVAMYATPAMRPWAELPEDLKEANRAQARDLGAKLDLLEAEVTSTPPAVPFEFTDEEVEMLARYEHDRWVSERVASGWTYGPRDDAAKTHDLLVPWLYLTPPKQEIDRQMIRGIPRLIEAAGGYVRRR